MPELPEVETIMQGLAVSLDTKIIQNINIRQPKLRYMISSELMHAANNQKILKLMRRGKYIVLYLQSGSIIIHLGMSGSLCLFSQNTPLKSHDHVDIILNSNQVLRYNDPRRFGAIIWTTEDPLKHHLLNAIGIEPLSEKFTGNYLYKKINNHTASIKICLMNSKIVAGIGNIYATEALFLAKIHPATAAKNLPLNTCHALVAAIKKTLLSAIKAGGTSLKDYVNSEGKPGNFAQQLLVYGKANLPCFICNQPLNSITLGQRCTVYCEHCQLKF